MIVPGRLIALRRGQNRLPGLAMASIVAAVKASVFNEEQLRNWHDRTARGPGDHPLLQHRGAHLRTLLGHERAPPGDPVHEALAVLVPDGRPRDVGAPALLADEVPVGDQSVDGSTQGDPADPVLGAEHRLGR